MSKAYIDGKRYIVEFDTRMQDGANGGKERDFRLERIYPIDKNKVVSDTDSKI